MNKRENMASKAFIRKWVKALRSGEFKQANDVLRDGGAYCCLGVACVLRHRESGESYPDLTGHGEHLKTDGAAGNWLLPLDYQNKLATLNDRGSSFAEIADYIEEKHLGEKTP